MARHSDRDRAKRAANHNRPRGKKRGCAFCSDDAEWVDYKDTEVLRRFMSDRGKIRARRVTGNCAEHQRDVAIAIKTARELALLPHSQRTVSERGPGRGTGRGPSRRGSAPDDEPIAAKESIGDSALGDIDIPEPEEVDA